MPGPTPRGYVTFPRGRVVGAHAVHATGEFGEETVMTVSTDAQDADGGTMKGSYVMDTRRGEVGEVVWCGGGNLRLRAPSGGREWSCPTPAARTVTAREQLAARTALANARSRGDVCR